MGNKRKTSDWYALEYDYGYGDGKEVLAWYSTRAEALVDQKLYVENEKIFPTIRKYRLRAGVNMREYAEVPR